MKRFELLNKTFLQTKDGGAHWYTWGKVTSVNEVLDIVHVQFADYTDHIFSTCELYNWIADGVLRYSQSRL